MKQVLFTLLASISCIATAAIQIPEGSIKQDSCGFQGRDVRQNVWKLDNDSGIQTTTVNNKLLPIGKMLSVGDAVFYGNIVTQVKTTSTVFEVASDIAFKGTGWTASDYSFPKGTRFQQYGTYTNRQNDTKFVLIKFYDGNTAEDFAAVKEDGFFCSGYIAQFKKDSGRDSGDNEVYQKDSLVKSTNEKTVTLSDDTIAITLVRVSNISATLAIKRLQGGQVQQQKEVEMDTMSGAFQIEGLKVSFVKANNSTLKILSVEEPDNYAQWKGRVKFNILKTIN